MTYHNKFGQRPKRDRSRLIPQIRMVLELLVEPGQVVELRILEVDRRPCIASGYFDDLDKLAEWALRYDGRGSGVYFTLNPVLPALRARCYNRIRDWAKLTTSDREVVARRWLLVDFDARRPSGVSSTDEEHQAAVARAKICRTYLAEKFGWPWPVLSDSGNGAHLLYRINLPNDEPSKILLQTVLQALDQLFTDAQVQLDPGVFNAARICKLYYTLAGKGDSIPDRPHRRSAILEVPETIKEVDITLLEALGALAEKRVSGQTNSKIPVNPSSPAKNGSGRYGGSNTGQEVALIKGRFDLMAYAQKHFPGPVVREGHGEVRLAGNQGLLINPQRGFWYQHGSGRGGDAIDLVGYVMYGERWNKHDRALFKAALAEAADFAGVTLAGPAKGKQAETRDATD